jgi:hypothetical protein
MNKNCALKLVNEIILCDSVSCMVCTYLHDLPVHEGHIPNSDTKLIFTTRPRAKEYFGTAAIFLFYIS